MAQSLERQRLQALYEKVKRMRVNQKAFFVAAKGSPAKAGYLEESKKNEADLDGFIKVIEYEQVVDKVN
jgi:hypothetical protein